MGLSQGSALVMLCALGGSLAHADSPYVDLDASLADARTVWLENCEGCHGYGIADAPIPMEPDQWAFRLEKGMPLLYRHAIEGFIGPDYSMMPAKGGNPKLTDTEVKAAVDYMTGLARYYMQQTRKQK